MPEYLRLINVSNAIQRTYASTSPRLSMKRSGLPRRGNWLGLSWNGLRKTICTGKELHYNDKCTTLLLHMTRRVTHPYYSKLTSLSSGIMSTRTQAWFSVNADESPFLIISTISSLELHVLEGSCHNSNCNSQWHWKQSLLCKMSTA